jgi:hypothetical protein
MADLHTLIHTFALVAGLAWASGLRLYLTLFVVGMLVHFGLVALPPSFDILAHPWVLAASGSMTVVEFLADKVPGFDTIWDTVHTFIRIPAGAILAGAAVGYGDPVWATVAAILGGVIASGTHATKAGTRALINASPEPFSNWVASLGEETFLVAGLWAMLQHPLLFLLALALLVLIVAWLAPSLYRAVRGLFRQRGEVL